MAKDHVAEVSRDVAIPPECANCGTSNAPFQWPVTSAIVGQDVFDRMFDPQIEKTFVFHFCLHCSRTLRRRQRLGSLVIIAGICVLLFLPVSIALLVVFPSLTRVVNAGPSDWFFFLLIFAVLSGPIVIAEGMTLHDSTPPVGIIDTGSNTIFFSFRSQPFRNSFAHLNGED